MEIDSLGPIEKSMIVTSHQSPLGDYISWEFLTKGKSGQQSKVHDAE